MGILGSLSKNTGGLLSGTTIGAGAGFLAGGPTGAAIGGMLGSGLDSQESQKEANKTNLALDRANRIWQERMSNSAYQRSMADMKKAGLNPMLAYQQGGASVPSTSAAQVSPIDRTKGLDMALGAFTGINATKVAQQNAQTQLTSAESSIRLQDVQTAKTVADTQNTQAETALKQRELKGKGVKDTLDREGGRIIQNILGKLQNSASPDKSPLIKPAGGDKPSDNKMFNWLIKKKHN